MLVQRWWEWYKFTKKEATKENAIKKFSEISGISLSDVIAFGDDLPDIGMLKLCGTGVAMGNAVAEVKAAADIVIGTNDEDGIAEYLLNYLSPVQFTLKHEINEKITCR